MTLPRLVAFTDGGRTRGGGGIEPVTEVFLCFVFLSLVLAGRGVSEDETSVSALTFVDLLLSRGVRAPQLRSVPEKDDVTTARPPSDLPAVLSAA